MPIVLTMVGKADQRPESLPKGEEDGQIHPGGAITVLMAPEMAPHPGPVLLQAAPGGPLGPSPGPGPGPGLVRLSDRLLRRRLGALLELRRPLNRSSCRS